jgi:hypothetical protein
MTFSRNGFLHPRSARSKMQSLKRLTLADSLAFNSFRGRIGIPVNQSEPRDAMRRLLPPGYTMLAPDPAHRTCPPIVNGSHQRRGDEGSRLLYQDLKRLAMQRELTPVLKFLEARLRRAVAEMPLRARVCARSVFVHGGVVAHRGRAIVIPTPP